MLHPEMRRILMRGSSAVFSRVFGNRDPVGKIAAAKDAHWLLNSRELADPTVVVDDLTGSLVSGAPGGRLVDEPATPISARYVAWATRLAELGVRRLVLCGDRRAPRAKAATRLRRRLARERAAEAARIAAHAADASPEAAASPGRAPDDAAEADCARDAPEEEGCKDASAASAAPAPATAPAAASRSTGSLVDRSNEVRAALVRAVADAVARGSALANMRIFFDYARVDDDGESELSGSADPSEPSAATEGSVEVLDGKGGIRAYVCKELPAAGEADVRMLCWLRHLRRVDGPATAALFSRDGDVLLAALLHARSLIDVRSRAPAPGDALVWTHTVMVVAPDYERASSDREPAKAGLAQADAAGGLADVVVYDACRGAAETVYGGQDLHAVAVAAALCGNDYLSKRQVWGTRRVPVDAIACAVREHLNVRALGEMRLRSAYDVVRDRPDALCDALDAALGGALRFERQRLELVRARLGGTLAMWACMDARELARWPDFF